MSASLSQILPLSSKSLYKQIFLCGPYLTISILQLINYPLSRQDNSKFNKVMDDSNYNSAGKLANYNSAGCYSQP